MSDTCFSTKCMDAVDVLVHTHFVDNKCMHKRIQIYTNAYKCIHAYIYIYIHTYTYTYTYTHIYTHMHTIAYKYSRTSVFASWLLDASGLNRHGQESTKRHVLDS